MLLHVHTHAPVYTSMLTSVSNRQTDLIPTILPRRHGGRIVFLLLIYRFYLPQTYTAFRKGREITLILLKIY